MPDTTRFGMLEIENGRITSIKAGLNGSCLGSCGCYILPDGLFTDWRGKEKFSFENEFLPQHLVSQPAVLYKSRVRFHDISTPEDYLRFDCAKS